MSSSLTEGTRKSADIPYEAADTDSLVVAGAVVEATVAAVGALVTGWVAVTEPGV